MPLRTLLIGHSEIDSSGQPPAADSHSATNARSWQIPSPTVPLSDLSEEFFINAYFAFYHTTYPFLHEATFRAQYVGQLSRPKGHTWPILLNTVLAIGAWCIGNEFSKLDDVFYNEVNRLMQDTSVFEVGNLALVQTLLLLSSKDFRVSNTICPLIMKPTFFILCTLNAT